MRPFWFKLASNNVKKVLLLFASLSVITASIVVPLVVLDNDKKVHSQTTGHQIDKVKRETSLIYEKPTHNPTHKNIEDIKPHDLTRIVIQPTQVAVQPDVTVQENQDVLPNEIIDTYTKIDGEISISDWKEKYKNQQWILDGLSDDNQEIKDNAYKSKVLPSDFLIPNTVYKIGKSAFENATLPRGFQLTENIRLISNSTFKGAVFNGDLQIPSSLAAEINIYRSQSFIDSGDDIPTMAFSGAKFNKNLKMDDSIKSLGESCFDGAIFSGKFQFSKSVKVISKNAFANTTLPINFIIGNDVNEIADGAFSHTKFASDFKLNEGLKIIGQSAFREAILPSVFKLPNTLKTIKDYAFWHTYIPEGFSIPISTSIEGLHAFTSGDECFEPSKRSELEWISNLGPVPGSAVILKSSLHINVVKEPTAGFTLDEWKIAYPNLVDRLSADGTQIVAPGFKGLIIPLGFRLPNTIVTISNHAFENCTFMGDFKLPNSVKEITDHAFENAIIGGDFILPSHLEKISNYAFSHTYFTGALNIPTSLKEITDHAFEMSQLPDLISIVSVTHVGEYAFKQAKFSRIDMPLQHPFKLEANAFDGCLIATSAFFIQSTAEIPGGKLTGITIPDDWYWGDWMGVSVSGPIPGSAAFSKH